MAIWQFASQGFATLLASAFGTVLTATLTDAQLESWGWRIPFLFGLLIGPIGYYLRRFVDESAEFVRDVERAPVKELDLPASTGFAATLVTGIVLTCLTPVVGHLSDRFGRVRIMLGFGVAILALMYPSFALLVASPGFGLSAARRHW